MIKRFGFVFSSGLLKIALLSLALTTAGWVTFGTPENIKEAAQESKLYDTIVTNVLESAKQESAGQETQLPLDRPEIEQAAKDAFSSDQLNKNGESIIDGFYGWLQGSTEQPEFDVNLNEAKNRFAANVADYAQTRYEGLPACTLEQLRTTSPDIDPFTVQCRAPGISGQIVREKVLSNILGSNEFLQDGSFTTDDLPIDENGKTITENLSSAPDAYKALSILPGIFGILSIVFAVGVLLLADTKRKGLKSIGITLLGTGVFLAIGSWLISLAFNQVNGQVVEPFQSSLIGALKTLVADYNGALVKFAVGYVLLGGIIILSLWYQKRQQKAIPEGTVQNTVN